MCIFRVTNLMFTLYSDTKEDDLQHHVAFLSSMCDDCNDNFDQNNRDYSFPRFAPCNPRDDIDVEY